MYKTPPEIITTEYNTIKELPIKVHKKDIKLHFHGKEWKKAIYKKRSQSRLQNGIKECHCIFFSSLFLYYLNHFKHFQTFQTLQPFYAFFYKNFFLFKNILNYILFLFFIYIFFSYIIKVHLFDFCTCRLFYLFMR